MIDIETQNRIVELRGKGKSQRTIADELGIGHQTVVRWEQELKEQIENQKAMELEGLLERYQLTVQAQIERYGVELARVSEEIQKRDLTKIRTPKLYEIMIKLDARVDRLHPAFTMRDDDEIADQRALRELVASRRKQTALELGASIERRGNGDGAIRAEDLVTLQLATLHRLKAGTIDGRTAVTEMAMIGAIFKGIDIADLQARLERIETTLGKDDS